MIRQAKPIARFYKTLTTAWGIRRKALGLARLDTLSKRNGTLGYRVGIATAAGSTTAAGLTVGRVLVGRARHRSEII